MAQIILGSFRFFPTGALIYLVMDLSLQTPFYEILGNDLFLSVNIFILTAENNKQVCLVRHHKVFKNKSFKDNFKSSF